MRKSWQDTRSVVRQTIQNEFTADELEVKGTAFRPKSVGCAFTILTA